MWWQCCPKHKTKKKEEQKGHTLVNMSCIFELMMGVNFSCSGHQKYNSISIFRVHGVRGIHICGVAFFFCHRQQGQQSMVLVTLFFCFFLCCGHYSAMNTVTIIGFRQARFVLPFWIDFIFVHVNWRSKLLVFVSFKPLSRYLSKVIIFLFRVFTLNY